MKNKSFKINVKNGFYIGDLCYALDKDIYDNIWGGNNYEDGQYVDPKTKAEFAMVGTAYGDGDYESSEAGVNFPVDAGIIGIADLSICPGKDTDFGMVIPDYTSVVFIDYDNGTITVSWGAGSNHKEIEIYTGYEDDYDYEDDYEEEYEDNEEEYDDYYDDGEGYQN